VYFTIKEMSLYKVKYKLSKEEKPHFRLYNALDKETAKEMFNTTVSLGSLIGEKPEIIEIIKKQPKK